MIYGFVLPILKINLDGITLYDNFTLMKKDQKGKPVKKTGLSRFTISMKQDVESVLQNHCVTERNNRSKMIEVMVLNYKPAQQS